MATIDAISLVAPVALNTKDLAGADPLSWGYFVLKPLRDPLHTNRNHCLSLNGIGENSPIRDDCGGSGTLVWQCHRKRLATKRNASLHKSIQWQNGNQPHKIILVDLNNPYILDRPAMVHP